jgi:hypothetical protein
MSIFHFNKFFINKKYHMKKLFTLLIALCSFLSLSFGQQPSISLSRSGVIEQNVQKNQPSNMEAPKTAVDKMVDLESVENGNNTLPSTIMNLLMPPSGPDVYTNDFSGGSVSGNTYIGTPTQTASPGLLSDYAFSTKWTATTGAIMNNSTGSLVFFPLPTSTNANINLKIKVRCGYRLTVTGVSFKHKRNNDGPSNVQIVVDGQEYGNSVPDPSPPSPIAAVIVPGTGTFPTSTLGEMNVSLNISGIAFPGNGDYTIEDFVLTGTYTYVGPTVTFPSLVQNVCAGSNATFTPTITPGPGAYTSPTYQWQKGNPDPWANISGATSSTYSLIANQDSVYRFLIQYAECAAPVDSSAISATQGVHVKPNPTLSGVIARAPANTTTNSVCGTTTFPITITGLIPNSNFSFAYTFVNVTFGTIAGSGAAGPAGPTGHIKCPL